MKKLIFIFLNFVFIFIYGQENKEQPLGVVIDSGYYYGVVDDSLKTKHIFLSFLSNDGDNIIYIVPYVNILNDDTVFLHNDFLHSLSDTTEVDGNILQNSEWSIPGFDNYSYYSLENDDLSFSLNIADFNNHLNVFTFNGKVLENGDIKSNVSSTDSTFYNSNVLLTFKRIVQ